MKVSKWKLLLLIRFETNAVMARCGAAVVKLFRDDCLDLQHVL